MHRTAVLVILGLFLFLNVKGQLPDLKFTYIGKEKGLSSSNVTSITQDSVGYIWIGTQDGLNKFDGSIIIVYKYSAEDSLSILQNNIRCLFTDKEGIVWIGTDDGLCHYVPARDNFCRIEAKVEAGQEITKIEFIGENDYHGLLYSMGNYLYSVDKKLSTSAFYLKADTGDITSFLFDNENNLWIGSSKGGGLYKFNAKKRLLNHFVKNSSDAASLSSNSVLCITLRGDRLWIATEDEGINFLNINDNIITRIPCPNSFEKFVRKIYVDNDNRLWVGDQTGIKVFDDQQNAFIGYYTDHNDPMSMKPNAHNIFQDKQGNYWTIHFPGGVGLSIHQKGFKHFDDNRFETWHTLNNNISAVHEDYMGNLWLANPFNGVDIFYWTKNQTINLIHNKQNPNSLGAGAVFALESDGKGMWIGSNRGGLQYLNADLRNFITYQHDEKNPNTIACDDIRSVLVDRKGKVWISVHGQGVDKLDPETKTFTHFNNLNNNLSNDWTFEIIEDHLGNIWVATAYGLSRLPGGKHKFVNYFTVDGNSQSLSDNEIITVFEDSLYRVWAGTSQGLNRYNRERDIFQPVKGDLDKQYICSILDDNNGNLWVGTLNGLFMFNPMTDSLRRFDDSDGLPTNEFNPRSSYKNMFNDLFFGTINGVVLFDPNQLKYNTSIPRVVISKFKLFNQEVDQYGSDQPLSEHVSVADVIELEYNENIITFEFTAINMIHPDKNSYAYRMIGFDENWHYVGTKREATYTNLNPGKYTFQVIASNNDGYWNTKGASIKVVVHPPWWRSLWFRILAVIFVIIAVTSAFYFRTNKLNKQKQHLEKEIRQSTAELQKKNTQLVEKSNHLNEINTLLEEQQQEIMEKTTKLQELNASKDRLFSIIAHDLTSPFNAIMGFSEMLFNNYDDLDVRERKEMAETIYDSSKRVYNLLDNLLNWARTQTNRIKHEPEELDLESVIRDAIDIYRFRLKKKNMNVEIKNLTRKKAYADIDMVRSITRNLISNATKYTPKDGKITIVITEDNNEIRTSITDTGIGISKEAYHNLFNLDRSSSLEGTDGEKGSGIGLILTNEFIGMNGGLLTIRSKQGAGSTFSFTLPIANP
jgi:signal transduction histidine kinase/ligand-binding sensor domain-containing protein